MFASAFALEDVLRLTTCPLDATLASCARRVRSMQREPLRSFYIDVEHDRLYPMMGRM
jgi:hypothetical protein